MDPTSKPRRKRSAPKVPIKTYKWEDVRRSRRKGGYPWTHLYKKAFKDSPNYNMDSGLRKVKASSPSDSLDIKEITEDDVKGLENIDSSYVVIEGPILVDEVKEEMAESEDNSDNISQYLDKEEIQIQAEPSSSFLQTPAAQSERAKSEEPRKRKLSIESNYSLSKQRLMKRLKDAKEKISSTFKKPPKSPKKKAEQKEKPKREFLQPKAVENPVYIHIPLKPPEGETDEFSYLEFGEKRPDIPKPTPTLPEVNIEVVEDKESENFPETSLIQSELNTLGTANSNLGIPLDDQEDDVSAVIFLEGENTTGNEDYDIMVVDIDEKSKEMTMSAVTNTEVRRQFLESLKKAESQAEINETKNSGSNLSRTSSRSSFQRKSTKSRRAKSAEPEKKRKSSIESSHSTKSSSFLKKIKEFQLPFKKSNKSIASEKIGRVEKDENVGKVQEKAQEKQMSSKKNGNEKPVYIHIPLKPPPGETDEFSYLEFESKPAQKEMPIVSDPTPTPEVEDDNQIETRPEAEIPQMILVTPPTPSDEEFLDEPEIPASPQKPVPEPEGAELAVEVDEIEMVVEEKMTIDEEDGLKSTQETKSNLKKEPSPLPKKKVSFKRRKSQNTKDDGYEDIAGKNDEKIASTSNIQEVKAVPEVSGKWSTSSDHEYEPINPPPSEVESSVRTLQVPTAHIEKITVETVDVQKSKSRSPSREKETQSSKSPQQNTARKFQKSVRENATKFKNKLQSIKRPNISLPQRPKFHAPKMPELPKLNLKQHFKSRSSPNEEKKETISLGGAEKSNPKSTSSKIFSDFSTYPRRLLKKKPHVVQEKKIVETKSTKSFESPANLYNFARATNNNNSTTPGSIRIPLHSEESMDQEQGIRPTEPLEKSPSPPKYEEKIQFQIREVENQWNQNQNQYQQSEIVTDLDQPEEINIETIETIEVFEPPSVPMRQKARFQQHDSMDSKKNGSSQSSLGVHRRGVLEEIDSDQFFLREKGISQDNIDMGHYLSSEIREAFRSPPSVNALSDNNMYNFRSSNQSLPETFPRGKRSKNVKKPMRKKTPVAQNSFEKLQYESEENINYNYMPPIPPKRRSKHKRKAPQTEQFYEENRRSIEDLNGRSGEELNGRRVEDFDGRSEDFTGSYPQEIEHDFIIRRASEPAPSAVPPPRKHRSLKSLNASQSIIFDEDQLEPPPALPPKPPTRSRSKTRSISNANSSLIFDETSSAQIPVVEEPCVQDLRDAMGYAIIDKSSLKNWDHKFCTVPSRSRKPPERPQRNYSTLTPSRPPRRKNNMTDEEKENIEVDITQYIEIDEKDVEKIQKRPLPPPPRPARNKTPQIQNEGSVEIEVSTQTEPLPPDFEIEQVVKEDSDKIMTPTALRRVELITPTQYTYEEETITHGQLVVEPLNGAQILPEAEMIRGERVIPIEKLGANDGVNGAGNGEIKKLKIGDLDVDRLNVNELVASKIIVSEIDSGNLSTNEISSKTGALRLGELELEPSVLRRILKKIQEAQSQSQIQIQAQTQTECQEKSGEPVQKKTPIISHNDLDTNGNSQEMQQNQTVSEETNADIAKSAEFEVTEVDEAPPRPPQPQFYLPDATISSSTVLKKCNFRRRTRSINSEISSSDDEGAQSSRVLRRRLKSHSEPSISQLTGRLIGACSLAARNSIKRLIQRVCENIPNSTITGVESSVKQQQQQQNVQVIIVMLLVLIAGLLLLGYGDGRTVHLHHWEYFNPPKDI